MSNQLGINKQVLKIIEYLLKTYGYFTWILPLSLALLKGKIFALTPVRICPSFQLDSNTRDWLGSRFLSANVISEKKWHISWCFNPFHAEQIKMPHPLLIQIFSQSDYFWSRLLIQIHIMTNSADPDQLASSEANWSGSTLFSMAEHIRVQQDQG